MTAKPRSRARRVLWRLLQLGGAGLLLLGVVVFVTSGYGAAFGSAASGEARRRVSASPHFAGDKFRNTAAVQMMRPGQTLTVLRRFLFDQKDRVPGAPLAVAHPSAAALATPPPSGLRLTWFGHSAVLIEIDGVRLLTDPMWGPRAAPTTVLGPARFHQPPAALEALGDLDAVIISHDHYDHLDMLTIRALMQRRAHFLVPLGVGAHLLRWGVPAERISEHDWWQEAQVGPVRIVATPAQHFSGRGVLDGNHTLWSSWTLVGPRHRVFFSGDTGLTDEYTLIRDRLGPFDLVMLEVGAHHPSWGDIHLGPDNALKAWQMLGGGPFLPIHWGTFSLALHDWDQPAEVLLAQAPALGVPLLMPRLGQAVEPAHAEAVSPWWRTVGGAAQPAAAEPLTLPKSMPWPVD